jgi:hypothetical protein
MMQNIRLLEEKKKGEGKNNKCIMGLKQGVEKW